MRRIVGSSCLLTALTVGLAATHAAVQFSDVFVGGAEGPYGTPYFRVPALAVTPDGDLLAFAEARPAPNDPGEVVGAMNYLVCKRSTNGGTNWLPLEVVVANSNFNYSDARPIIDHSAGNVLLVYSQWPNGVPSGYVPPGTGPESSVTYYRTSSDNGQTWDPPVDINVQVKDPSWAEICTGPGAGIQLRWQTNPSRNGRLIISPYVRRIDAPGPYVFETISIYSASHGANWTHSAIATGAEANEAQLVELTNGDLLMDSRPIGGNYRKRWISHDGGSSWGTAYNGDVPVTTTNCGLIRYSAKCDGDDRDRILFSAPLGVVPGHAQYSAADQCNLGLWTSYDEGKTFINPVQIDSGFAHYSAMQKLQDGSIAVLFEKTDTTLLRLAKCSLSDLESHPYSPSLNEYDGFGNDVDRKRGGIGWTGSWTGPGVATNTYSALLGSSGLDFAGASLSTEDGRMDLTPGNNVAERQIATPIDLNTNSTAYISLLVSGALDTSPDPTTNRLDIKLLDTGGVARVGFGVGSHADFFISRLGNAVTTASGAVDRDATYLMVLKIISEDASSTDNFDQLFLDIFESGMDTLPTTDAGLTWMLVGETNTNSSSLIDRISLAAGGSLASWSFDELRIGETFASVVGVVPEPSSVVLVFIAVTVMLPLRFHQKRCSHRPGSKQP